MGGSWMLLTDRLVPVLAQNHLHFPLERPETSMNTSFVFLQYDEKGGVQIPEAPTVRTGRWPDNCLQRS